MTIRDFRLERVGLLTAGLLCLITAPAQAADQALLDILRANGAITQEQYDALLEKETLEAADVVPAKAAPAEGAVTLDSGGLRVKSSDGRYAFKIGARLHSEYSNHSGAGYLEGIGARPPVDGSELRRARIESSGQIDENWNFAAEVDFADNNVAVKDFWLRYTGFDGIDLTVGHQKQPYALNVEMSSNDIPFIERSVDTFLLVPFVDRAIGARIDTSGQHWFFAGGIFGDSQERQKFGEAANGFAGVEGWGVSGRFVYAPIISDREVLHLGIRGSYRNLEDNPFLRLRDETTHLSNLRIVDTGLITNYDDAVLMGPEFAWARGRFSVTGEHNDVSISRIGSPSVDFNGWYVSSSWWLTGESLASAYRIDSGEFKRVKPTRPFDGAGGTGAWELAARYSAIDLNDQDIVGGTEDVLTLGANWYPNNNIRFMFEWSKILDTDESNAVRAGADNISFVQMRAQFTF